MAQIAALLMPPEWLQMRKQMSVSEYERLRRVQERCFLRGRKKWARALGQRLAEARVDNPQLGRM